jgi:hypothetical protein
MLMVVLWLEEINLLEQFLFNTKLIVLLHYQFLYLYNIYRIKDYLFGAGLSRLLTAFRPKKGLYIEIIEARNRIGGRIHTG